MLTVLGGLAEFERDLIRARTSEGRARAVANGVRLGRKPTLTPHQRSDQARQRRKGIARRNRALLQPTRSLLRRMFLKVGFFGVQPEQKPRRPLWRGRLVRRLLDVEHASDKSL
jgi:hypothetical protein